MKPNILYAIIGALVVICAVLGYHFYQERQQSGVEISVGHGGVSIQKK